MSQPAFRGNKASLPQKPCVQCGRPMVWRKRWARTWGEVKYCSDRCRDTARRSAITATTSTVTGPVA